MGAVISLSFALAHVGLFVRGVYNTPFTGRPETDMSITGENLRHGLFTALNLFCIAIIGWIILNIDPGKLAGAGDFAPRVMSPCVMDQDGYLRGRLYGSVEKSLDWQGAAMLCDGMPRPEGEGFRLVFAEHSNPDQPGLVLVIGLADAVLGDSRKELEANVTVIDQNNGQFYSTQDEPRCWTQFSQQLQLRGTSTETWRVDGELYCASALAALTGTGSVTLDDITFSGVMKPSAAP
jgi:hypothetical protein